MKKMMTETKTIETKNAQRLDALVKIATAKDTGIWRKVGVAFPLKNRAGYSLKLELLPAPTDGAFEFILVEPSAKPDAEE